MAQTREWVRIQHPDGEGTCMIPKEDFREGVHTLAEPPPAAEQEQQEGRQAEEPESHLDEQPRSRARGKRY